MISIIICSRKSDIPQELKNSVVEMSGTDFEFIVIDNSQNKYSIFSAYNEGVRRSRGSILCFMHDDITFKSQNWGQIIENHFADSSIGMIGVAGSHYMPDIPFYWATPFVSVHNLNKGINGVEEWFYTDFFGKKTLIDCVTLDGLCYFIRKSLFDSISYDEKSYSGFHFYDMDISMQVLTSNYRVCVCRDLLLEHQWFHNMNKAGMELFEINKNIFFNKWKNHFPITRGIDAIPKLTIERVTQLYQDIYKLSQVKKTHAYKLGYAILYPYKLLKRIINKL